MVMVGLTEFGHKKTEKQEKILKCYINMIILLLIIIIIIIKLTSTPECCSRGSCGQHPGFRELGILPLCPRCLVGSRVPGDHFCEDIDGDDFF